jgi:hypothetical protein
MGPSTRAIGGTRMGDNRETNVVDRWGFAVVVPSPGSPPRAGTTGSLSSFPTGRCEERHDGSRRAGNVIVHRGAGDDVLIGGGGSDIFMNGEITIQSFVSGEDKIDLTDVVGLTFDSLTSFVSTSNGDTVIDTQNGHHITLLGIDAGSLHRANS